MGRIFASSDWHGHYDLGKKALDLLTADDKLYFLGDAMDRGPDGVKMLELLLNDPRVTFIMGNHEEFFIEYMPLLLEDDYETHLADLWTVYNGGMKTWESALKYPKEQILEWVNKLRHLPKYLTYENKNGQTIHLSHAGFTPDSFEDRWGRDYLWDRDHICNRWQYFDDAPHENEYVVHGHTPVQYLYHYRANGDLSTINKDKPDIFRYCDGHKFDIDLGTIESKRIGLLDLDTFESIYVE